MLVYILFYRSVSQIVSEISQLNWWLQLSFWWQNVNNSMKFERNSTLEKYTMTKLEKYTKKIRRTERPLVCRQRHLLRAD